MAQTSHLHLLKSSAQHLAFKSAGLPHTTCNAMDRWKDSTRLFRMIGKLATDKKAQWEQHLPELLQAYNSTRSAVMGYSPHYLMFGR